MLGLSFLRRVATPLTDPAITAAPSLPKCDSKRREYERRQKHWELESIAIKESRLLIRLVHRMKVETALQRDRQLQIMGISERTDSE